MVFDHEFHLKLTDFGLANRLEGVNCDGILNSKVGTAQYWAPEIFKGSYEGMESDIFAIGMILYVLVFSSVPFRSAKFNDEFYRYFRDGKKEDNNKFWDKKKNSNVDEDLKELFRTIFNSDPKQRPNIQEMRNCNWIKNGRIASEQETLDHFSPKYQLLVQRNSIRG